MEGEEKQISFVFDLWNYFSSKVTYYHEKLHVLYHINIKIDLMVSVLWMLRKCNGLIFIQLQTLHVYCSLLCPWLYKCFWFPCETSWDIFIYFSWITYIVTFDVLYLYILTGYNIVNFWRLRWVSESMLCSSFSVWLISLLLTSSVFCKWHNFIFLWLNMNHVLCGTFFPIHLLVNILMNSLSWLLLVLPKIQAWRLYLI